MAFKIIKIIKHIAMAFFSANIFFLSHTRLVSEKNVLTPTNTISIIFVSNNNILVVVKFSPDAQFQL